MPKRVIRIQPPRAGRRVRWTFEVSADVDGQKSARTTNSAKKAEPSRLKRRKSKVAAPHKKGSVSTPASATTRATNKAVVVPVSATAGVAPSAAAANVATQRPPVARGMTRSHVIALAAVATLVVAVVAVPRRSALVDAAAVDSKPEVHASTAQPAAPAAPTSKVDLPAPPVAQPQAASPVVSDSMKKSTAKPTQSLAAAPSNRLSTAMPAVEARERTTSAVPRVGIEAKAIATTTAPVAPTPEIATLDQVTITGCLEASESGDRFRLTDTEGANAPKARSWRTGFLKKHSAAVDLVAPRDVVALQSKVGQRVAVSGMQTNRELKVSAVRVVSPSCN